jgi:hypothetical protein
MKSFAFKSVTSISFLTLFFLMSAIAGFAQTFQVPGATNNQPTAAQPQQQQNASTANAEAASSPASPQQLQQTTVVVKVGIAMPKTQVSEGANAAEMAAGLRQVIAQYLKSPAIEVVELEARLPQALAAEAREKGCAYILQTALTQKKGGGGFGKMFGALAPVMSNVVPMAGMTGSVAGAVAGSVASQAIWTAASLSSNVKSKDQITFEYALVPTAAGGAAKAGEKLQAKAKSDGEDVLSPMIEKMAETVVQIAK